MVGQTSAVGDSIDPLRKGVGATTLLLLEQERFSVGAREAHKHAPLCM